MEAPTIIDSSATYQQQAIRCKLAFNGQLRCCMLASPSWDVLQDTTARLFNIGPAVDRPFKLRYVDDEGDAVSLDTTQELCEAVAATENNYLKLLVDLNSSVGNTGVHTAADLGSVFPTRRCHKHVGKHGKHAFGAVEMEALLTQLEERGFGQRMKRNARLLRKTGGDVEAVVALLREADAAAGQRRLARQQRKLGHAQEGGIHHGAHRGEKKTRRAKHDPSADDFEAFVSLADGWPAGVNALYLDGNNMLFLSAALRKHALGRGQRWKAEAMLTSLAESFARAKSATGLQNTVMIYDSISRNKCGVKTLEGGTRFAVASARPEFATSDDALVAWAKAMPPAQAKASLFITSDRELKDRLIAAGALVAKPKQWVELARRTVEEGSAAPHSNAEQQLPEGEEREGDQIRNEVSLDDFLEEWGKKLILADATDSATDETVGQAHPPGDEMLFQ